MSFCLSGKKKNIKQLSKHKRLDILLKTSIGFVFGIILILLLLQLVIMIPAVQNKLKKGKRFCITRTA